MSLQAAFLLSCALQCTDPPVPPGGFAFQQVTNQLVVLSDGQTTTASVRYPDDANPCGWPMIVFIHGLFGSKGSVANISRQYAGLGYVTLGFDVRGHATATGYHTLFGQRERLDVVELIRWVHTTFPGIVDPERIGLAGSSQGGLLALSAAVHSGLPIETNPWLFGTYPQIDAVVIENLTADYLATFAPESLGLHCNVAAALLGTNVVRFDPALVQDGMHAVLEEDFAAWAAIVGDPTRDPGPMVPAMTTPVLAMGAWDDFWFPVGDLIARLEQVPAQTPRKVYLGTNGHNSPPNQQEQALRDLWQRQWLDRFLKSEPNGIDLGDRITYAVTPADVEQYLAPNSTWERGTCQTWPPENTIAHPLYLRELGQLWPFPPKQAEPFDALHQTVGQLEASDLVTAEFRLPQIEAEIPRVAIAWDSPPMVAPLRFVGDPRMHLSLTAAQDSWQVAVSLWDVDPSGEERYVTSGSYRWATPGSAGLETVIEVRLGSQAYEFPAGHVIRLRLENMHVHDPPVGTLLRYAPNLQAFDLEIYHSPGATSWLDLPVAVDIPISYGWSQANSQGCEAIVTGSGLASISGSSSLWIQADNVLSHKDGMLIYGYQLNQQSLGGGVLFVKSPLRRCAMISSGGNPGHDDCSGSLVYDFSSHISSCADPALVPGTRVYSQFWSRDPASPWNTNLTNGVEFSVFP